MSDVKEKFIALDKEVDFTPSALRDFLNIAFKHKATGKPFTPQDIQQYELRGALPFLYGGHGIDLIESKEVGLKILRIEGLRQVKKDLMSTGHYRDYYLESLQ